MKVVFTLADRLEILDTDAVPRVGDSVDIEDTLSGVVRSVEKTVAELRTLNRESPDYWKAEPA